MKNIQHQLIKLKLATSTVSSSHTGESTIPMLSLRMEQPLCKFGGLSQGLGEYERINKQEVAFSEEIKIPNIERIPPYTFSKHLIKCV